MSNFTSPLSVFNTKNVSFPLHQHKHQTKLSIFTFQKSQKVHRVRFATVPYPNIYLFKNKPTPPHKINFHRIIIKKL